MQRGTHKSDNSNSKSEVTFHNKLTKKDRARNATTSKATSVCSITKTAHESITPSTLNEQWSIVGIFLFSPIDNDKVDYPFQTSKSASTIKYFITSKTKEAKIKTKHAFELHRCKNDSKQKKANIPRNDLDNNRSEHKFDYKKSKRESIYKKGSLLGNNNNGEHIWTTKQSNKITK